LHAEANALTAQADAIGIDTYAILDDIARTYADATQDEFNAKARDALAAAIARGNQDGGSTAAQAAPAAEPAQEPGLTAPTRADIEAQQEARDKAEREEAARQRAEDQAASQDENRKRIAQASVRAAAEFEFGQDPLDSLTGQGGLMFSRTAGESGPEGVERGIAAAIEKAVQQWQVSLRNAASNPEAKEPGMATPAVLRIMGAAASRLVLPRTYLRAIMDKHGDVPASVFENLPALLADPLFIIPHKDGGLRVFVEAQTAKGEPIAVGVSVGVDGRIHTVTPLHDHDGMTGQSRMARAVVTATSRIYAKNKEALAKAKASAEASPGTIPLQRNSNGNGSVITRADVVKRIAQGTKPGDPRFSFAGAHAATADTHALVTAQDRLDAGEDPETVRQETGWHRGPDGRMRFEISDNEAKVDMALLANLHRGGFAERGIEHVSYRQEQDGTYSLTLAPKSPQKTSDFVIMRGIPENLLPSLLPQSALDAIEQNHGEEDMIGPNLDDARRVRAPFQFRGFNALPLDLVMDHPKLFAAYPALREIMVQVDPKLGSGASFAVTDYVDGTVRNVISIGNPLAKDVDSALLHEIQHGIQNIEGFATGDSPERLAKTMPDVQAINDAKLLAGFMERGESAFDARQRFTRYMGRDPNPQGVYLAERNEPNEIARMASTPLDAYKRNAGEVEARNTQARQKLTADQRRATSPSQTADVADSDVIVVFNGKEMANAPMPTNAVPDAAATVQPLRTPASTIRAAITKAYGKLLGQLESKGLVTLTQTQEQAIEAAARARADKTGQPLAEVRASLMGSVSNSKRVTRDVRAVLSQADKAGTDVVEVKFGAVDPALAGLIQSKTHKDVGGFEHSMDSSAVRHARNEHGDARKEAARGQIAITDDDLRTAPQVIFAADRYVLGAKDRQGNDLVGYVKQMPDGTVLYVEEVRTGRKTLAFKSIRKYAATSNVDAVAKTLSLNARSDGGISIVDARSLDIKRSANGAIQGFFDPQTGQSFLIADNLTTEAAPGVLMHEVGIHMAADGSMKALFNRAAMMLKMQRGNPFIKAVQARMDAAGETSGEEAAAYIAEAYENDRANAPASVQRWLADLLAAVKAWMFKKGIMGADRLTVADIAAVARANARSMARDGGATGGQGFGPAFSVGEEVGAKALAEFAKADELFALPKSTKDTVEGIAADNDAQFTVSKPVSIGGRLEYTVTLPDGTKATLSVREPNPFGGEQVYDARYTDDGMELVPGRPGENPDDVPPTGDVWIDVSDLKKGDFGAKMYNIAATYAHNTGRIFIGDPHGLSKDALRRRLEQMISSALKFGTTAHLAPHPDQTRGGHGVPPLRWVYGDHVGNVERMIAASVKALDNGFPQSKLIEYRDGNFYNANNGKLLPRGRLATGLGESIAQRRSVPGAEGSTAQAGWRTVARAALFRHFQSSIRDAASGIPQRGSLLARGGKDVSRLERGEAGEGAFDANERIFYSRAGVSNTGGQAATGWDAPVQTGFDDVIYKLQDKNIDLKRVVESITKSVGQVAAGSTTWLGADRGRAPAHQAQVLRGVTLNFVGTFDGTFQIKQSETQYPCGLQSDM
jgi:hypothetical protein